jgi:hypothetical protein
MPPGMIVPESNSPVREVTVWGLCPVFVQQTVVPWGTVTSCGLKTKSCISTCVVPASQVGGGGGPAGPLIAGVLPTSAQTAMAIVSAAK